VSSSLSPVDPQRPGMLATIGVAHFAAGRLDAASSIAKTALLEQPKNFVAAFVAAASNAMEGNPVAASDAIQRVHELDPNFRVQTSVRAFHKAGRTSRAMGRGPAPGGIAGVDLGAVWRRRARIANQTS
jgi:hypothetical protein